MKYSCITIGTFDGVHIGHKEIISTTFKIAETFGLDPVILTLSYPPKFNNFQGERYLITTEEEKLLLLNELGARNIEILGFSKEIEEMVPDDFVTFLMQRYRAKHFVVGYNHTFGKDRRGDVAYLASATERFGITVTVVPPVIVEGEVVSSTLIRNHLTSGNIRFANKCLGRYYTLSGVVIEGAGVAKSLGFRTINLRIPEKKLVPKNGVYAVLVHLRGKNFPGACYIGESPTLGLMRQSVEVHVIDFDGELYGDAVTISFVDFLRDDMKFSSIEELRDQISRDVLRSKRLIAEFF